MTIDEFLKEFDDFRRESMNSVRNSMIFALGGPGKSLGRSGGALGRLWQPQPYPALHLSPDPDPFSSSNVFLTIVAQKKERELASTSFCTEFCCGSFGMGLGGSIPSPENCFSKTIIGPDGQFIESLENGRCSGVRNGSPWLGMGSRWVEINRTGSGKPLGHLPGPKTGTKNQQIRKIR